LTVARQGPASDHLASGHPVLDARLPGGGWPASGLCEVLHAAPGVGELALVWPALARLSQRDRPIVLVAPPYRPHAPAWAAAGLDLAQLQIIHAAPKQALWAAEQCLRSAACAAVLCWPHQADDRHHGVLLKTVSPSSSSSSRSSAPPSRKGSTTSSYDEYSVRTPMRVRSSCAISS